MPKPNYGIDAPGVVRGLALMGLAGVVFVAVGLCIRTWPSWWLIGRIVAGTGIGMALGWGGTALVMLWGSKFGKLWVRERAFDAIPWRGDERVLDVGCGRGNLLIGAAKRLPRGRAVGVDL